MKHRVVAMLDVVLGPLWVLLAFGETPISATLVGGAFVVVAAVWRLAPELRRPPGLSRPRSRRYKRNYQ